VSGDLRMEDILQNLGDFETKIEAATGRCEHGHEAADGSEGWNKPVLERLKIWQREPRSQADQAID
jgi:hypothetical protein